MIQKSFRSARTEQKKKLSESNEALCAERGEEAGRACLGKGPTASSSRSLTNERSNSEITAAAAAFQGITALQSDGAALSPNSVSGIVFKTALSRAIRSSETDKRSRKINDQKLFKPWRFERHLLKRERERVSFSRSSRQKISLNIASWFYEYHSKGCSSFSEFSGMNVIHSISFSNGNKKRT